jgi:stage II sporulation protein D
MLKQILIFIFTIVTTFHAKSQNLRIGLFNENSTKAAVINIITGSYLLTADNRAILTAKKDQYYYARVRNDSVLLANADKEIGVFKNIQFKSMTDSGTFSLRPVNPSPNKMRLYDDNLELSVQWGFLQTINFVDIEKYIAGVVEAEGGVRASPEYYKSQAVLCRTYVLSHLDKHSDENFYMCDGTHCQAYNGRSIGNLLIPQAALQTKGLVVVDPDSVLITAAFHSNCGGETENAENVWMIRKSYLRSIKDPYCQNQRNYSWEQKISRDTWKSYLQKQGFNLDPEAPFSWFNCVQYSRKVYYKLGKDSIPFKTIRNQFDLKSAFFSIKADGNDIIFKGRGYGHGVGLCQEGAMQMAKLGYNFREILQFYYQGVNITDYQAISPLKNPALKMIAIKK